ncbi:MAG: hypothetical protein OXH52_16965 [Gammaproteobacteria bacterium]|nr:hypothetical protein [Gammaproteobacteria bacterium]
MAVDIESVPVRVERRLDAPIIDASTHPSIGANIQGPSLTRAPDWLESPLGRYYLYFADHKGSYIRLAFADALKGPWNVHAPGSLQLEESHFPTVHPEVPPAMRDRLGARTPRGLDPLREATAPHIASPDVHVDDAARSIIMYFHGLEGPGHQVSRVATSRDGIHFEARPEVLGRSYMRVFQHDGMTYAMAMPGRFYRSRDGFTGFEEGPLLFNASMRHAALLKRGPTLYVFWTQVGDAPERILLSTVDLTEDWKRWKDAGAREVLRPERVWEGARAPVEPSVRGPVYSQVNQLRDPAIYVEGDRVFLLYAVAGESGIALAEVLIG